MSLTLATERREKVRQKLRELAACRCFMGSHQPSLHGRRHAVFNCAALIDLVDEPLGFRDERVARSPADAQRKGVDGVIKFIHGREHGIAVINQQGECCVRRQSIERWS